MFKFLNFFLGLGENTHAEPRTLLSGFTHRLRDRYVNLFKAVSEITSVSFLILDEY
jgi:hypothetical protein